MTQAAFGESHGCALHVQGTVKCWGRNSLGQLGDGMSEPLGFSTEAVPAQGITNATQLYGGRNHTCALLADGTVTCWGFNQFGQLGNGTTTNSDVPVQVAGITNATAVSIGGSGHTACALLEDGAVRCWGRNKSGQLGNGTTVDSSVPVQVQGVSNANAVTAGSSSCALLDDGTVRCWGYSYVSPGLSVSLSAPEAVPGINDATYLSDGCALLAQGTIKCWGSAEALGNGSTQPSPSNAAFEVLLGVSGQFVTHSNVGDGWVLIGDSRAYIDPECRAQLEAEGRTFTPTTWNQISDLFVRPTITCEIIAQIPPADSGPEQVTVESAIVGVKADGRLYTRFVMTDESWGGFVRHGAGGWTAANTAVHADGSVTLVAVKANGALWTRRYTAGEGWGSFVRHGANTWDPSKTPAVAVHANKAVVGAIKSDGRLYTRVFDQTWGPFERHGLVDWTTIDLAWSDNGRFLAGTKQDGRLYTRAALEGGPWGSFTRHGYAGWRTAAIAATPDSVMYAGVKNDGRLYTRTSPDGNTWNPFVLHQPTEAEENWKTADLAVSTHETEPSFELAAIHGDASGQAERIVTRSATADTWSAPNVSEAAAWQLHQFALRATTHGEVQLTATTDGAKLITRTGHQGTYGPWQNHGQPTWAIQPAPAPIPTN